MPILTPLRDDFNRANEQPPTGWTTGTGLNNSTQPLRVLTNQLAKGTVGYRAGSRYNTVFPADQEAWVQIGSKAVDDFAIEGRIQNGGTASGRSYVFFIDATSNSYFIQLYNNGAYSAGLAQNLSGPVWGAGDYFILRIIGTSIQGIHISSGGTETLVVSATDSTITGTGQTGINIGSSVAGTTIENFGAGGVGLTTRDVYVTGTNVLSSTSYDVRVTGQGMMRILSLPLLLNMASILPADSRDVRITGDGAAQSSSNTRDVRITGWTPRRAVVTYAALEISDGGSTNSDVVRDARVTGHSVAIASRDARVTGYGALPDTRDVRVTAQASTLISRDVRVTGQASLAASYDARLTAMSTLGAEREVRAVGTATLNSSYVAAVTGQADNSDARDVRTEGLGLVSASRDANITGIPDLGTFAQFSWTEIEVPVSNVILVSDIRDVRITGQVADALSVDVWVVGQVAIDNSWDVRITGSDTLSLERETRVTGRAESLLERNVRTTGQNTLAASYDARISAEAVTASAQDVRLFGSIPGEAVLSRDARVTAQATLSASYDVRLFAHFASLRTQDARITGRDTSVQTYDARLTGRADSVRAQDVRLQGRLDSSFAVDSRITGRLDSIRSQDVRLVGQTDSSTTRDVRVQGRADSATSYDVRVSGESLNSTSRDARIVGRATSDTTRDVRVIASAQPSSDSRNVRITGIRFNQILRPVETIENDGWKRENDAVTNLELSIDEPDPDASDYIKSSFDPNYDIVELRLGTGVINPIRDDSHIVRYEYRKNAPGGQSIDLYVTLLQGSTVIATWLHQDIDALTRGTQTLTIPQAQQITDYDNLIVRFEAKSSTAARRRVSVTKAELEVPNG